MIALGFHVSHELFSTLALLQYLRSEYGQWRVYAYRVQGEDGSPVMMNFEDKDAFMRQFLSPEGQPKPAAPPGKKSSDDSESKTNKQSRPKQPAIRRRPARNNSACPNISRRTYPCSPRPA